MFSTGDINIRIVFNPIGLLDGLGVNRIMTEGVVASTKIGVKLGYSPYLVNLFLNSFGENPLSLLYV